MHHVLLAFPQHVQCSNHVKLSIGIISLLRNPDLESLVVFIASRVLLDIRKILIDFHVDGV